MPYSSTDKVAHGDFPLAATINNIIANQAVFNVDLPNDGGYANKGGSRLVFVKCRKFLWFKGTGSIIDFNDSNNTVSISTDDFDQYDLDSISWMYQGKIFYVYNCDWAELSNQ